MNTHDERIDMKSRPTPTQIALAVCKQFDVLYSKSLGGVKSTNRSERLSITRATIVHIGKHYEYSYPQITPYAGYKSHASAQSAHRKYRAGSYDKSEIYKVMNQTRESVFEKITESFDNKRQAV